MERWKQIAVEIGHSILNMVNSPEDIGTKNETGYALMFFNAQNHRGKSTFVSSETNPDALKQLLKTVLENLEKAEHISPQREH